MGAALLAAQRSKDPNTKVGAAIANKENKLVGIGYNGFPINSKNDAFPWNGEKETHYLNTKYPYVCHAELNAILNCIVQPINCTLYVTLFPCNECAKVIIQSRISSIYYLSDKYRGSDSNIAAKSMFNACGVDFTQLVLEEKIVLDLSKYN